MDTNSALAAFGALSQKTRTDVVKLLVKAGPEGMSAGDIGAALDVRQNTMSANLSVLLQAGLISNEREGRSVRYFADLEGVRDLVMFLLEDCCGGHPELCAQVTDEVTARQSQDLTWETKMSDGTYNVLFLCTGNSARSIMAEAILNRDGQGRFKAYSAGSQPAGTVRPEALALLAKMNYKAGEARSKSWDEFAGPDAPEMDFVFTVCDNAAKESCPVWPGQPMSAHWGVPDPAAIDGNDSERQLAFAESFRMLSNRISIFTSLPMTSLDKLSLQKKLDEIGKSG